MTAMRTHGLVSFDQVDCIVLETTGVSSIAEVMFALDRTLTCPCSDLLGNTQVFVAGSSRRDTPVMRRCTWIPRAPGPMRQGRTCFRQHAFPGIAWHSVLIMRCIDGVVIIHTGKRPSGFRSWTNAERSETAPCPTELSLCPTTRAKLLTATEPREVVTLSASANTVMIIVPGLAVDFDSHRAS